VKSELGKNMSVMLDCRTRWNSLADMLSRLLQLHGPVQKALIDLGQQAMITDADFTVISEVVSCLEPLKLAVNALCRRETNLISAHAALNFCVVQLQKQNSELARTLADVLETRIKGRHATHAGVLQYLHNTAARATPSTIFTAPSNDVIRKFIHRLVTRLDQCVTTANTTPADDGDAAAVGDDTEQNQSSQRTERSMKQSALRHIIPEMLHDIR